MHSLSIITVNLNNLEGLKKTMQSVFEQKFTDYEYIVIDGGSSDGSKEWIAQHADKLSYWVSEKDNGIYNAMNKGINATNGNYIFFLNSGDRLVSNNILDEVCTHNMEEDIIYGNLYIEEQGNVWEKKYPSQPSFKYFINDALPHSGGAFIKKSLFKTIGLYNEAVKICADWMFFVDAIFKYNATSKHLPIPVSYFLYNGISAQEKNRALLQEEKITFLKKEFALHYDYEMLKQEHQLLKNSRMVKLYSRLKKIFQTKQAR